MSERACGSFLPDLVAYLDGELPPERAEEVSSHLESCAPCQAESGAFAASWELLDRLPALEPRAGWLTDVEARVRAAGATAAATATPPRGQLVRPVWGRRASLVAAAALLLTAGLAWLAGPGDRLAPGPDARNGLALAPDREPRPDREPSGALDPVTSADALGVAEPALAQASTLADLPPEERKVVENLDLLVLLLELEDQDLYGLLDVLEDLAEEELNAG